MIENLLHARIALSKRQLRDLGDRGIEHPTLILGDVAFLGSADRKAKMLHLFFRFEAAGFDESLALAATTKTFGNHVTALFATASLGVPRFIVTTMVSGGVRNPSRYLHTIASRVASEFYFGMLERKTS